MRVKVTKTLNKFLHIGTAQVLFSGITAITTTMVGISVLCSNMDDKKPY